MSIQVKNLTHIYEKGLPGEQRALDNVSFTAEDGQLVGIIGHTGSGKSTLVQHLNGLLKADEGHIIVGDTDITEKGVPMVQIRKRIGLVFQYPEYQLFEETVAKDVAFGPKNLGLSLEEIEERVKEAIQLVGLNYEELKDRSPFELSGGQKRRVAIAGVVAMRPEVLILDEPTAGLDPKAHKEVLNMVEKVHKETGNITILVSHNMTDVARICDKVLVMNNGMLEMSGTPREVFSEKDKLHQLGLELPPITQFTDKLRARGMELSDTILTLDQAVEEITQRLNK